MSDKFTATWVSHTSIADFLNCPRAYFLKNVYRRPETNHKIQLTTPPMSLGSAVHEVIEALSVVPTDKRFTEPLVQKFELAWEKYHGRLGGFYDIESEYQYKKRGLAMVKKIEKSPGPLANLAVKISMELPYFWLSENDNIILCGKIDWIEYLKDSDSVRIIDFKTSRSEEKEDSLQLPIYILLAKNCQKRQVDGASYWYLESAVAPGPIKKPDVSKSETIILDTAKKIKVSKALDKLQCPLSGCRYCEPYEKIFQGVAEFVGVNSFGQDCFILPQQETESREGQLL